MAEETQVEVAPEAEGMAALGVLTDTPAEQAVAAPVEPKIDAQGRSYATGRRKNATARVWLKRGSGLIVINGRDVTRYFARPVLQMLLQQPFETTERVGEFDVMATVVGGGLSGQAGAIRHGISPRTSQASSAYRSRLLA